MGLIIYVILQLGHQLTRHDFTGYMYSSVRQMLLWECVLDSLSPTHSF